MINLSFNSVSQLRERKANNFCNVAVKPYKGKKHDPANTVVVVVG